MCIPLAVAGLIITAASAAASFQGQRQQAKAQEKSLEFSAGVARNNQILAEHEAVRAEEIARTEAAEERLAARRAAGRARTQFAGSGVVIDQDSALDITSDIQGVGELNALRREEEGAREAFALRLRGQNFQTEAQFNAARASSTGGSTQGAGQLLGTGATVASKWYSLRQAGAFSGGGGFS